ncbi:MAG: asparagine synthase (glutamine-hydrolyzing) [Candidatus Omnitrophota bacterium]
MCGVCGIYSYNKNEAVNSRVLEQMTRTLTHRGPDDEGFFCRGNVGLGMRRLSIIDIKGGHQPIYNEDKSVVTICNGEIYNFRELRQTLKSQGHNFYTHSDTEVIVHLYEQYGEGFMEKLRGMFAIALYDAGKKILLLGRDHVGIKPLYYCLNSDRIIFGSEIKAIHACHPKSDIDLEALTNYLSFMYIAGDNSIFTDIKKLRPGSYIKITPDGATTKQYWNVSYDIKRDMTEEDALDKLEDIISRTVKSHLMSDVPLGAFLSGGLDSSLVVYFMTKHMSEPVKTFSIGFKERSFDETKEARLIAKHIGTDHAELIVEPNCGILKQLSVHYDEPFADYSSIPFYFVSKLARQKVTVALTGDGGDELFGGYPTYFAPSLKNIYMKMPSFLRKYLKTGIEKLPTSFGRITLDFMAKRFVQGAELSDYESHLYWRAPFDVKEQLNLLRGELKDVVLKQSAVNLCKKLFYASGVGEPEHKLMFIDYSTLLFDDILTKSDRMSMAHSLEVRVPLCDRDIIEFAATVPARLKVGKMTTKILFRKLARRYLPARISTIKKKGFSPPAANWIYSELKDYVMDVLSDRNLRNIGLFNISYVKSILDEHFSRKKDNNRKIWTLLVFAVWWSEYYKKSKSFS